MSLSRNEAALAAVSTLDDRVRARLYAFVSGRTEPTGRDQAAAAVGIGRALAVYHLDKLVEAGLLTAFYRRPPGRSGPGAGRPAKVYSRSGAEFIVTVPPRDYELAAGLLMQAVAADRSGHALNALHAAAWKLGVEFGNRLRAGDAESDDLPQSLATALSERGYEPWQDEAGTVRLRNCPFRHLVDLQPELVCHMNLALIRGLIQGAGANYLSPVLEPAPEHCCVAIPQPHDDMDGTR